MNTLAKNPSKTTRHLCCASCCKTNITGQPPPQNLPEQSGTYSFTHDSLQRLEQVTKDGKLLRSYEFDSYGNRTKLVEGDSETNYHFNALNQLILSVDASGIETNNTFDKRGNQIEKYLDEKLVSKHHFGALNRLEEAQNFSTEQSASYFYSGLVSITSDNVHPS